MNHNGFHRYWEGKDIFLADDPARDAVRLGTNHKAMNYDNRQVRNDASNPCRQRPRPACRFSLPALGGNLYAPRGQVPPTACRCAHGALDCWLHVLLDYAQTPVMAAHVPKLPLRIHNHFTDAHAL